MAMATGTIRTFLKKTVLCVAMLAPAAYAEEVWKITSLDWQPYSGADMATQGNSIQKLRELLKKEGITLQVDFFRGHAQKMLPNRKNMSASSPRGRKRLIKALSPRRLLTSRKSAY